MVTLGTFKYAFKYVHKGPDHGALELRQKDEVKCWIDGHYISPPDAIWRLLHFITYEQVPNVVRLQVHLKNHQVITFNPNHDLQTILQRGANHHTSLTAWFEANQDQGQLGEEARRHTVRDKTFQMFVEVGLFLE